MEFRLEEVRCICGKDGSITLAIIELRDGKNARIVECQNCGLQYITPRPDKEFLNWLYKEEYYASVIKDKDEWIEKTLEIEIERENLHLYRLKPILEMREQCGYKTLLDIGAGTGYFLKLAKDRGFDVFGIEVSERASEFARENYGVNLLNITDIEEARFHDGSFDVVTLCHVVEHLLYPEVTLKEIYRILQHNGMLLIITPNCMTIETLLSRLNRRLGYPVKQLEDDYTVKTWRDGCYHLYPRSMDDKDYRIYFINNFHHLYFFNPKTLKELLLRCNFSIDTYPVGRYPHGVKGIRKLFSNRLINLVARIFNLQAEIMFYAKKL